MASAQAGKINQHLRCDWLPYLTLRARIRLPPSPPIYTPATQASGQPQYIQV